MSSRPVILSILFIMLYICYPLRATELLFFDLNRDVTRADRGFPGNPLPGGNGDWTSPVDYTTGTFYYRVEIRSMPTDQDMMLPLFFWQGSNEAGPSPGSRPVFDFKNAEAPFIHTWARSLQSMKKYHGEIDWSSPRSYVRIAVKNGSSGNVSDRGGMNWSGENPDDWFPMDMRYSAVIVKQGDTFLGWESYGMGNPVKIKDGSLGRQGNNYLLRNTPNPCNFNTKICFDILENVRPEVFAAISIFDMNGRKVKMLAGNTFGAGRHSVYWDSADSRGRLVPAGQYIYKITINNKVEASKRLNIVR